MKCPLVLLVEVHSRGGKAVGSEKGKVLGRESCYEQRAKFEHGLHQM
jgi:hypothetical protein